MGTKEIMPNVELTEEAYNRLLERIEEDTVMKKVLAEKFANLNLEDGFLFASVMRDKRILNEFLNKVLDIKVGSLKFVVEEYYEKPEHGSHAIRLDIAAEEYFEKENYDDDEPDKRKYNVEMQKKKEYAIGRRTRYYHSVDSVQSLNEGTEYSKLPDSYIVFVSMEDPFDLLMPEERQADKYHPQKYVFSDYDRENIGGALNSGSFTIVLANVEEKYIDKTKEDMFLTEFFRYATNTTEDVAEQSTDEYIEMLQLKVNAVKNNPIRRRGFMVFELMMQDQRRQGIDQGMKQGMEQGMEQGGILRSREIARSFLESGTITLEDLARHTKLPLEEVISMKNELEQAKPFY